MPLHLHPSLFRDYEDLFGCELNHAGSEAMYADLGHFSRRSIKVTTQIEFLACRLLLYILVVLIVCGARFGLILLWNLRKWGLQWSMQIAFTCVVYPSLLLGYIGQAAYLSKNLHHVEHGFYHSIPSMLYHCQSPLDFFHCCIASSVFIGFEYSWTGGLYGFAEPVFWPVFITGALRFSQFLPCRYVLHFLTIRGVSLVCNIENTV